MTSAHTIMGRTDKLSGIVKILGDMKLIPGEDAACITSSTSHVQMLQVENEIE